MFHRRTRCQQGTESPLQSCYLLDNSCLLMQCKIDNLPQCQCK